MAHKLEVRGVGYAYHTMEGETLALSDISFTADTGEFIAIVGPSGCGKSTLLSLLCGLVRPESGSILIDQKPLDEAGNLIGYMLQKDHLFEWRTILSNVSLGLEIQKRLTPENQKELKEMLKTYGLEEFQDMRPSQLSGGMRQRAMIAMAMSCNPKVLIADEPTTALDVTIQAQIFELMDHLKKNYNTAIMMITHDMGVVCELADDVAVMYMGNIIESGSAEEVLDHPTHPYTKALLKSIPILGKGANQDINPIKGSTPDPYKRPPGCQFEPRCDYACEECKKAMPDEHMLGGTHMVRCTRYQEVMKDGK